LKKQIVIFIFLFLSFNLFSQAFKSTSQVFSAGISYGGRFITFDKEIKNLYAHQMAYYPAINLYYDVCIVGSKLDAGIVSIGFMLGYKYSFNYGLEKTNQKFKWHDTYIAIRPLYHFQFFKDREVDFYSGLALGIGYDYHIYYEFEKFFNPEPLKLNSSNTFPVLGAILGGRYYFHKPYGVFAEVGYGVGIGYASIGFCYHLIR